MTDYDAEKAARLADRLPVADWLKTKPVRIVEKQLRAFGLSRAMAKQRIHDARISQSA